MTEIEFNVVYHICECLPDEDGDLECWCGATSPYIRLCEEDFQKCVDHLQDGDEVVIIQKHIKVCFNYPLAKEHIITLSSPDDSFTRLQLATAIALKYQQIYREERETSNLKEETMQERGEGILTNRARTDGKWEIWGHVLWDLDLGSVRYTSGVYHLEIDS
jgi:hypothetical protein